MEKSRGPGSPLGAGTIPVGVQAELLLGLGECTQPLQSSTPEVMGSCSEPWLCHGSLLNLARLLSLSIAFVSLEGFTNNIKSETT